MGSIVLTEVRRKNELRALQLAWSDGHTADFDFDYLRAWCPCAMCQGHHALEIRYLPTGMAVEPRAIEPVGNYGISLAWTDGHATGIYRFEFLREICPCADCRREGPARPHAATPVV